MKKFTILLLSAISFFTGLLNAQPTQPAAPIACNASNCTAAVSETCTGTSTVVASFTNATLQSGSPTSLPAVYSFYNIATVSGQQVNATVTIESQSNCAMNGNNFSIDDDGATDQSGNSIASFFAPRITGSGNLGNSDQRGYVQFVIRFYVSNGTAGEQYPGDYTTVPASGAGLSGLNYIHYDIDGTTVGNNGWFRETGVVENVLGSVINANASTELVSYTYADGPGWKGFAGSVCERTGVSRCAQVAAAASYVTPQAAIRFRMGYDYNYTNDTYGGAPTRQYGSRFGCFSFPQISTLPVKLLSFTGTYKNNTALLNWTAENQTDFDSYVIERSTDGVSFEAIATKQKQGTGLEKQKYQHSDDLVMLTENTFYYRLKMVDIDSRFQYSNAILIRKGGIKTGLQISPNPVVSGNIVTARFEASRRGMVETTIADMSGRIVLRQQNQAYEGVNSIAVVNINRLQPGMYMLQINDGQEVMSTKLSVVR